MAAAVAIFLHLWGVFSIGQQEYLLASVLLLVGQFVLGMQIQWKINNGLHVSDIRIGFLVFYFLYGVVLPLSTLFGFGSVQGTYPGDPGLYGAAFLYASGLLAFNIVQIFWPTKWKNPELRENVKKQYFVGSIIILLVLLYGVIFYALSLGVELRFDIDRSGRSHLNICIAGSHLLPVVAVSQYEVDIQINGLIWFFLVRVVCNAFIGGTQEFLPFIAFFASDIQ